MATQTDPLPAQGVIAPSGAQIDISHGDQRAVVVEVGGGLRTYESDGRQVLDGYAAQARSTSGRGQVLIPWPNRLADGRYDFDGETHQLPLSEPDNHNAIHGLTRWVSWTIAERDVHRVVMQHVLHPQPGYPFTLALRIEYRLDDAGLTVRTSARNAGSEPCPYGAGMHPYLTVGTATVDPVLLTVPGRRRLILDERGIPTGDERVDGTAFDFRKPRRIEATRLDDGYTDLERGGDGLARVDLSDPASGAGLTLWVDEAYRYLMVFSGDGHPDVERRSLAVEPMTCPPNAFQSGTDVVRLAPGEGHAATWGIGPWTHDPHVER